MDLAPSSILFIPVAARLAVSIFRYNSIDILFIEPRDAFLYCMGMGILGYGAIMHSSLFSGILVGLGSRAVITYVMQGRRWTVLCGILLGIFSSDVVTLFWTYVNQESERWNLEYEKDQARRRRRSTKRRISDPRPPNAELTAQAAALNAEALQNGDADEDTVVLKRKLAQAEADINRLQEERKWSMSQGNDARTMQLERQVNHNEALARNYRKELGESNIPLSSETSRTARVLGSIISGMGAPSERHTSVKEGSQYPLSDAYQSDAEPSRLRRRAHLTQRFTLEDGSEVKLTQIHLGRDNEKESTRVGRSVPITIIDSPTSASPN